MWQNKKSGWLHSDSGMNFWEWQERQKAVSAPETTRSEQSRQIKEEHLEE